MHITDAGGKEKKKTSLFEELVLEIVTQLKLNFRSN